MFCENLREATGFDNNALVNKAARLSKMAMTGRLPAIARKRTGPIDIILRDFPRIVERLHEDVKGDPLAIVDWAVQGEGDSSIKRTISFTLNSDLPPFTGRTFDGQTLVELVEMELAPTSTSYIPVGPGLELTDVEDDAVAASWERLQQHPVGALCESMYMSIIAHPEFKLLGQDDRLAPTMWFFKHAKDGKETYLILHLLREEMLEELKWIMG